MIASSHLNFLSSRITNPRERACLDQSISDHIRNGRGFWPVVTIDGALQVVRFSPDLPMDQTIDRWTPETGGVDLIPLYALPVTDWPRVRIATGASV